MHEGMSLGGWTVVGAFEAGGPGAFLAAKASGEEAVLRIAEVADEASAEELAKAAEKIAEVSHPGVARMLAWGVAAAGGPPPAAEPEPLDSLGADLEARGNEEALGGAVRADGGSGAAATLFWTAEEFVPGATLRALIGHAGGRVPVVDAGRWAAQICAGLSALHAHGVVVGDLRPETIVVTPEGDARITAVSPFPPVPPAPSAPPEAAHFASPEAARGGEITFASDLYSLGAILYRAVTGSVVFDAPTAGEVASLHATSAPEPPRRMNPAVPASFEMVVVRALAKEPKSRYGSAEEMRQDLERVSAGGSVMGGLGALTTAVEKPQTMSWWKWVLIGLAAFLVLGAVGAGGYLYLTQPVIPDLAGLTEGEAAAVLEESGLVLGQVSYRPEVPEGAKLGTILGQDPPPGRRVSERTVVDVVVAGARTAPVPSVVGLDETDAIMQIQQAGFRLGSVTTTHGSAEDMGRVISQEPSGGMEIPEGSPVAIVVSRGPELVTVPGVIGQTRAAAEQALKGAGFTVEVIEENHETVVKGNVIRQSPDAGVTATKGAKVTIHISKGKGKVTVPNVIGLSEAEAKSDMRAAGLKPVVQYRTGPQVGKVVDQSPSKGTQVDAGSTIYITVERTSP